MKAARYAPNVLTHTTHMEPRACDKQSETTKNAILLAPNSQSAASGSASGDSGDSGGLPIQLAARQFGRASSRLFLTLTLLARAILVQWRRARPLPSCLPSRWPLDPSGRLRNRAHTNTCALSRAAHHQVSPARPAIERATRASQLILRDGPVRCRASQSCE